MSSLRKLKKDQQRRLSFNKQELSWIFFKSLYLNKHLSLKLRSKFFEKRFKQRKLNYYGSLTKIRNRCVLSGSSHSVIKKFKMSRMCLREQVFKGNFPGVGKTV